MTQNQSLRMTPEEKIKSFLEFSMNKNSAYHNHKENMAHAALVVEIATFVGILTFENWDNFWLIKELGLCISVILFSLYWLLIHLYIRIQLRLKRWAALNYAGYFRAYSNFINVEFTKLNTEPTTLNRYDSPRWFDFLDYIIPLKRANIKSDIDNLNYPTFIVVQVKEQFQQLGSGSARYEWVITISSIVMYTLILLRMI